MNEFISTDVSRMSHSFAQTGFRTLGQSLLHVLSIGVLASLFVVLDVDSGSAAERELELTPGQGWVHLFSGRTVRLKAKTVSRIDRDVTVSWSFSISGGIVGRGEQTLKLKGNEEAVVAFDVDIPELKSGVIASGLLRLLARPAEGAAAFGDVESNVVMYVMSPDVLGARTAWWKSLDVVLFDPAEKTQKLFARESLPVLIAGNAECSHLTGGLIMYGAGMDEAHSPTVWDAAITAAESGRRVLIFGSPGEIAFAGRVIQSEGQHIRSVTLRRAEALVESDRRLDSSEWPAPGRLQTAALRIVSRGDETCFDIASAQERSGWAGLDVRYHNGGRLIWTGVGFIESWDATPAARYGLVKLLEEMTSDEKQRPKGVERSE